MKGNYPLKKFVQYKIYAVFIINLNANETKSSFMQITHNSATVWFFMGGRQVEIWGFKKRIMFLKYWPKKGFVL